MSFLNGAIYGMVGGALEAFPLSFSGMISLLEHFLNIRLQENTETLLCVIAGAALAFLIRYFRKVTASAAGTVRMLVSMGWKGFSYEKESTADQRDAVAALMSVVPTAAIMIAGEKLTAITGDIDIITEGICFLLCGAVLTAACKSPLAEKADGEMRVGHALIIGTACALSVFPGISAVAAGTSAAILMGYEPEYAYRHSLIPSLTACLFAVLSGALPVAAETSPDAASLAVCVAAAAAAGFVAVLLSGWLLKKDRMMLFAYISIVIGLVTVIAGAVETASGMSLAELIAELKG